MAASEIVVRKAITARTGNGAAPRHQRLGRLLEGPESSKALRDSPFSFLGLLRFDMNECQSIMIVLGNSFPACRFAIHTAW